MQTRFQFRNVSFLFFSGISLLFLSCKKETTELEKNIEKWHSFKICNYTITRAISCYCLDKYTIPKSFKIENCVVTHIDNEPYQDNQLALNKTIDEMFEFINELHTKNTHILEVTYDEKYGFPTYLYVDYDKMIADDETSYSFSKFTPTE
tara:strand:- start:409 stop:858 length:450 start_codon:yes stop_codon:yes gene_type:complete